jgi:3-hydroxyacyl-[acyl-carrier-protein] dehydratase
MSEAKHITEDERKNLEEVLKRCPAGTLEALVLYREAGDVGALNRFLTGCLKRHIDQEYYDLLDSGRPDLSFIDDLGIDSMTMMEVAMMIEECLLIRIDNQELVQIQTLGDLDGFIKKTAAC